MYRRWGEFVACEFLMLLTLAPLSPGQIRFFPHIETFDSVSTPLLPDGWNSSFRRLESGDFFTTRTSPHSSPQAVQSTNSTLEQFLVSPLFDFTGRVPAVLQFFSSRSGTHTSPVLVEASLDGGSSFPLVLGDTLTNPGSTRYVLTAISLPEPLANRSAVRFRWHVLGDSGGTSGTFRMDDISIQTYPSYDLSIGTPAIEPQRPTVSDRIAFAVRILNQGTRAASGYSVDFFLDEDEDGIGDLTERFAAVAGRDLNTEDSTTVTAFHPPLRTGEYHLIVSIDFSSDEISSNDTTVLPFSVSVTPGTIIINEIMYAPSGDEPEWVELFNTSADTIDLKDWQISDSHTASRSRLSSISFPIPDSSFVIVARDSLFRTVHPDVDVPVAISGFSALNNTTPDAVVLFDPALNVIDSVQYSPEWGGQDGRSLERRDAVAASTETSNWSSSTDSSGSTPGRPNSIVRLQYDLALTGAAANGSTITILATNVGRATVRSFGVDLIAGTGGSPFGTTSFSGFLRPHATAFLTYVWSDPPPGETRVLLRLTFDPDQRAANDTLSLNVTQSFDLHSVVINEIMYEPDPGQQEWIELYNRTDARVSLDRWFLRPEGSSGPTTERNTASLLLPPEASIPPRGFLVVAADSSILALRPSGKDVVILNKSGGLSLGNDGDRIVICDLTGLAIDSLVYQPSWHTPDVAATRGHSLERIDPDHDANDFRNWGTSTAPIGSTPGELNTLFVRTAASNAALAFSPNPFSPDGDGFEEICVISYRLPVNTAVLRVRIFDRAGRLIQTLADGLPAASAGEILWNGYDAEGRRARVGPYVVLLEAVDNRGGLTASVKGVIVVATRL